MTRGLLIASTLLAAGLVVASQVMASSEVSPEVSVESPRTTGGQTLGDRVADDSTSPQAPATASPNGAAPAANGPAPSAQTPPARLIKHRGEAHAAEHAHPRPLDDRCRPLNDELETALQKQGNAHRLFQARVAHNAGNRLCRDGHPDRGIAELERGLSYLQENPHP